MSDQELIEWYKRVFNEYPSVGLLAFIREVMEQAAPVSAWERVPDGQYSVADDDRFNIIVRGQQVQLVTSDLKYLISAINLRDDWKLMRQRPATAAGEEE